MKRAQAQQEDVAGLFRKFGGDAAAYKEFAPLEMPAAPAPVATPPSTQRHPVAPAPPPPAVALAAEPRPLATDEAPASCAAPRALDRLFARLDACPPAPASAARGLMTHWRTPG